MDIQTPINNRMGTHQHKVNQTFTQYKMIRIPTEVKNATTEVLQDETMTASDDEKSVIGIVRQLQLTPKDNSQEGLSVENTTNWTFHATKSHHRKGSRNGATTFNFDQLVHNTLEHMDPEWSHRNGENVTVINARVGHVVVAHEYHWWVPTSLCES
jgi:hypothetical protein